MVSHWNICYSLVQSDIGDKEQGRPVPVRTIGASVFFVTVTNNGAGST